MPITDIPILGLMAIIFALTGIRFAVLAGGAWLAGYVLFPRRWAHRKIVPQFPGTGQVRREMRQSLMTLVVFTVIGCLTVLASHQGWTQIYTDRQAHSWTWFWASIAIAVIAHDTYFYWTHRVMHHPLLYRRIHLEHHRSTNPTPWASYAFSPVESVIEAGILPLLVFTLPMHPLALSMFLIWQTVFNVIGHTGYEYNHRHVATTPLRFLVNTPTSHIMHHQRVQGNFGLYFNWWDRLMGTNHPDYDARLRDMTSRVRPLGALA